MLQELSTPLPADPVESNGTVEPNDGQVPEPKKKKRRKAAEANQKSEGNSGFPTQPTAEKENMNDSIRRLYSQSVGDANLAAKAERLGQDGAAVRKAKEKAAAMAARREQGLSDPRSAGFAPEDRPEERLEDLGGLGCSILDWELLGTFETSKPPRSEKTHPKKSNSCKVWMKYCKIFVS